jgi:hypothetical protein
MSGGACTRFGTFGVLVAPGRCDQRETLEHSSTRLHKQYDFGDRLVQWHDAATVTNTAPHEKVIAF